MALPKFRFSLLTLCLIVAFAAVVMAADRYTDPVLRYTGNPPVEVE